MATKFQITKASVFPAFIVLELSAALVLFFFAESSTTIQLVMLILVGAAIVKALYSFLNAHHEAKNVEQLLEQLQNLNETYLNSDKTSAKSKVDIAKVLEENFADFSRSIDQVENDTKAEGSKSGLLYVKLNDLKEKVRLSNEKDKNTIWASEGHSNVAEILRANSDNLENACYKVISFLTKYVNAQVGAIYIAEEDQNKNMNLELKACYAFNKRRIIEQTIDVRENLIGQCFLEQEVMLLKEVPENYLKITSGLGENKPRNLILVPLKFNDTVHGVVELASFHQFSTFEIDFLKKLSEIIASSILQVRNSQQTRELLNLSQNQSEEMRASEEELRQNMEELESTQEQMHRQVEELTSLKKALEKERYLFEALMNSLPDAIYFKDRESKLVRVSKHMEKSFGIPEAELIGKSDFDFQDREHAKKAFDDERTIMLTRRPLVDIIEKETRSDGTEVWVATTKLPLINASNEVVGTFGISRNISKLKNLEKTVELKEKQMEAEKLVYEQKIKDMENQLKLVNK
jgi:methyl-accepting chemotaxis protein